MPLIGNPDEPPRHTPPPKASPVATFDLYLGGERVSVERSYAEGLTAARAHPDGFVWLNLTEPSVETLTAVAETFDLHRLPVEDAIHGEQRPKYEEFGETSFLVLRTAIYVEHERLTATSEVVETGDLMVFVAQHFVVSVLRGAPCDLERLRDELSADDLSHGPWSVVHGIVDAVVDEYVGVVNGVRDDIDKVEQSIFESRRSGDVQRIYKLNREVMELRRAVTPLSRPLSLLASSIPEAGAPDVPLELRPQFRDIQDHLSRVIDQLNGYDSLLNSVISASLAEVAIRQNDDMRRISAWVAIAAVPTMIAGIYGMNFDTMPELTWTWGYPLVVAVMATICTLLYRGFRRSGWL